MAEGLQLSIFVVLCSYFVNRAISYAVLLAHMFVGYSEKKICWAGAILVQRQSSSF